MSNHIPNGWELLPIGETIELLTDFTANGSFASLKENVTYYNNVNHAALVRTTDLEKFNFQPQRFTDKKGYDFLKKSKIVPGDIVIANVGSTGKAYRVPEYYLPMTLAPNMYLIKFNAKILSEFAFRIITGDSFVNKLLDCTSNTALSSFNKSNFKAIEILVPPNNEQIKIAEILNSIDESIEAAQTQINKLKNLKIGMMQELLTKGVGHTEFKESSLGRIPKAWTIVRIGELGCIVTGNTPKTSESDSYGGSVPFISPGDIGDHMYVRNSKSTLTERGLVETRVLPKDSVLVVCIGSTIGKTGLTTERCATNQQINSIICKDNSPQYVYYLMTFFRHVIKGMAGTQAVPIINKTDFSSLLVPLPPIEEQRKIANAIFSLDSRIENLEHKLQSVALAKKGLMQDLLTGKVRVKVH